jgi:hypothetical protein
LQDRHSADLCCIFEKYQGANTAPVSDWVYKGTETGRTQVFRLHFGLRLPKLAWFSNDSRDYYSIRITAWTRKCLTTCLIGQRSVPVFLRMRQTNL